MDLKINVCRFNNRSTCHVSTFIMLIGTMPGCLVCLRNLISGQTVKKFRATPQRGITIALTLPPRWAMNSLQAFQQSTVLFK